MLLASSLPAQAASAIGKSRTARHLAEIPKGKVNVPQCPLSEIRDPSQHPLFHDLPFTNFGNSWALETLMNPVPLFDPKFVKRELAARSAGSAALGPESAVF